MTLHINPGSGPVEGATERAATFNLGAFLRDLTDRGHRVDVDAVDLPGDGRGDGRWTYTIVVDDRRHEVDMPGLALNRVRWMDEPDQNIWDFPRLYVDGSSWVWKFALDVCGRDADLGDE